MLSQFFDQDLRKRVLLSQSEGSMANEYAGWGIGGIESLSGN